MIVDIELHYILKILKEGNKAFMDIYFKHFYDLKDYDNFVHNMLKKSNPYHNLNSEIFIS